MPEPALLYEKDGPIALLTMNRPEARNAVNCEMLCRFADAWEDVNNDPAIRVAILTGAGEQAFCAGADLDKLVRMMQGAIPAGERVRRAHQERRRHHLQGVHAQPRGGEAHRRRR
jgi:enoyl-CoA hydratase/carnithine racemase